MPSAAARAPGLRVAPAPSPSCPAGAAPGSRGREGTRPAAPGPPSSAARSRGCSLCAPRGDPAALLERVGQVYQGVSEGEPKRLVLYAGGGRDIAVQPQGGGEVRRQEFRRSGWEHNWGFVTRLDVVPNGPQSPASPPWRLWG